MKYLTTYDHPELKQGIEISQAQDGIYYSQAGFAQFTEHQIKAMLESGKIKEVQEKEFTKDDMKSYRTFASGVAWTQNTNRENIFDEWINQRK